MIDPDSVIPFERLPEKFAESVENPPSEPATPRPAATIVLMRDGSDGMEILLMKRNRSAGFVPGAYVFPGGRVDGSDATDAVLERMDGLTPQRAADRLDLQDGEPPAISYYLAALREAFEEAGILVAHDSEGNHPPTAAENEDIDAIRDDLMEDRISFAEALDRMGCRIEGESIEYFAHWITPLPEPRRYDTRFFAARVSDGATPIVDPREMTDAVWITPSAALSRCDEGTLPMIFPTIKTLEQFAEHGSTDDAIANLGAREIRTVTPTLVITPTGIGMDVGDDGSDEEPGS
jgi:8-oxo-dGTP pyrophosphatase MutT (NUDIX family)